MLVSPLTLEILFAQFNFVSFKLHLALQLCDSALKLEELHLVQFQLVVPLIHDLLEFAYSFLVVSDDVFDALVTFVVFLVQLLPHHLDLHFQLDFLLFEKHNLGLQLHLLLLVELSEGVLFLYSGL